MAHWVKNLRWIVAGLGALTSVVMTAGQATAADAALTELYGYGVHRYYAGDYQEAQRVLNIVIDSGVEDPRPHYFRGLVTYQMGMQDAAKSDFEHAADLEARGKGTASVGWALQRIQGPVRKEIEMARMMARVAVAQEQRAKKEMDAQQSLSSPDVGKPPAATPESLPPAMSTQPPAATPATPPAATPTTPPGDAQDDPFKDDAPVPAPTTPADPATPAAPADPFGDAPATPAAPAGEAPNPFN